MQGFFLNAEESLDILCAYGDRSGSAHGVLGGPDLAFWLRAVRLAGSMVALPANLDSADTNDDSIIDGGDVTKLTNALFGDRIPVPEPFIEPGLDPTPDSLTSCPGTF